LGVNRVLGLAVWLLLVQVFPRLARDEFAYLPGEREVFRSTFATTNWTVVQSNLTSAATWWNPTTSGASFFRVRGQ
jgi:hypothetical protein